MVYHGKHSEGRKKKPSASDRNLWGRISEEGRRELMVGIALIVLDRLFNWICDLIARWIGIGT